MSQPKKIVDLKDYASKLLSEIDEEVKQKTELIEKLRAEVEELRKQRVVIEQILATIDRFSQPAGQSGVTVKAQVELPKEKSEAQQEPRREEGVAVKPEPAGPVPSGGERGTATQQQPKQPQTQPVQPQPQVVEPAQRQVYTRPFNGERRWEPIVVNNTEYASYSVSPTMIHLVFKFGVPADSKYVRGFIIDKYLQKMKEESAGRVARGEIPAEAAFNFEVKTNENGEIVEIKILNYAHDQLQDLLNKIKWFVASEVRDLRSKGRLS